MNHPKNLRIDKPASLVYQDGMSILLKNDILNLSVAERILLVEDIWDSVAEVPEAVELSEADKAELDSRLELYHLQPDAGSPWGLVKERIKNRYGA